MAALATSQLVATRAGLGVPDASTFRRGAAQGLRGARASAAADTLSMRTSARAAPRHQHHIMAGADVLAVTSRFEPCGLIQLQGMRYGTPCACASTGGLVDTIIEGKTGFHMGRLSVDCNVVEPADVKKVATTLQRAIKVVGTPAYEEMVRNCMIQDLSWKGPAKNWENVLLSLGVAGGEPGVEGEEIAPLAKENVAAP
uniref:NDP-glucose--starch glucosyltransferase n=1 Tax=Zea mays subsp. mays TaxID=381124 RepID=F5A851_MAIZE|nr:GBSS1 [Zea mays subsp. mays]AED99582.1 GBSSI [Zea mays subsp. mays]